MITQYLQEKIMAKLSSSIVNEVLLEPSLFDKNELSVTLKETSEFLGTIAVSKEGHKASSARSKDSVLFNSLKFAVYFLINSKITKSKKNISIPGHRMLIELLQ